MLKDMKAKYFFGSLLMAVLGAAIALFAYTNYFEKGREVSSGDSSSVSDERIKPLLTSFQQAGQVDFT